MRIAVDRQGERADFVDVTAFGKLAEVCAQHLRKGRQVAVQARLSYREWEVDGQRRSKHEVIAASIDFLGEKPSSEGDRERVAAEAA